MHYKLQIVTISLVAASKASENTVALSRIDGRLNGELDARIEAAVAKALGVYHAATREDCTGDNCPQR